MVGVNLLPPGDVGRKAWTVSLVIMETEDTETDLETSQQPPSTSSSHSIMGRTACKVTPGMMGLAAVAICHNIIMLGSKFAWKMMARG